MILVDVNVLLASLRTSSPGHGTARVYLEAALVGTEPVGILDETLTAVLRIATNPHLSLGIDRETTLAFCKAVRSAPATQRVRAPETTWARFVGLVEDLGLVGNDLPDAWLAALAMELGATLATFDRGFGRFPGLAVRLLAS